ncbi:MAG TPA: hypothetical protein PKY59_16275 [Pyrinomonadaceae bacterium]|nr:hypothetical protein [Pyrinomonadaceae bacterium]
MKSEVKGIIEPEMNEIKKMKKDKFQNQEGTAIVIALLVMVLLMGFVALAISRTNSETVAAANDAAETRTFEAAQASLEIMTRNFDKIFDRRLNPTTEDLQNVQTNKPPGFDDKYDFSQVITKTKNSQQVVMTGGEFQGLKATRDEWEIRTVAEDKNNGTQVELRRRFFNNRIPIFQFGIFYEDDMEFHPGPRFDFGGRVHSNGNLFMAGGAEVLFSSKVTAVGEVFTDTARNDTWGSWNGQVKIKNASGTFVQLKQNMGSVLKAPTNGSPVITDTDYPTVYRNANWSADQNKFEGNLLNRQKNLELPIKFNSRFNGIPADYIELVKRGKKVGDLLNNTTPVTTSTEDDEVTSKERYYNKTGIRVSLADSKAKLPGCASGSGITAISGKCGIRLDGAPAPGNAGSEPSGSEVRGYQPLAMKDGYQATELNGERFYLGISGRQTWIKIETVKYDETTNTYITKDITEDMLSLGITDRAKNFIGTQNFKLLTKFTGGRSYGLDSDAEKNRVDNRSIFKLQRFYIDGAKITTTDTAYMTSETINTANLNYIVAAKKSTSDSNPVGVDNSATGTYMSTYSQNGQTYVDKKEHWWEAIAKDNDGSNLKRWVVPFPINMFDAREGLYNVSETYTAGTVPWNGVMSAVDIDVENLRRFFLGEFDANFPNGTKFATDKGSSFKSTDVPSDHGWVLYVSDRRGDYDFDGEYDMEDIYGNNDGILQKGEDVNNNNALDTDYCNEAVRYKVKGTPSCETDPVISTAIASVFEHKFYRRGVRLINGQVLPGNYSSAVPANTKGFTVASENAVYVIGNYNSTGATVTLDASGAEILPTPSTSYQPQGSELHIPASIVADTVYVLSNSWKDGANLANPFSSRTASETTVRFAMISGDSRSKKLATPNQGSGDACMAGGVHNFKRFLENWGSVRLNYTGSLINLYNARNNNGAHKSDGKVYGAPQRNWTFDTSFLDPDRLPPGTPFFQSIQLTGFERLN